MTFKEWNAAIMVTSGVLISAWVAYDALATTAWTGTVAEVAADMLWAIGYVIAFNIVAVIVVTILVSIVQREELKGERADAVSAKAMRNGYFVLSISCAAILVLLALGIAPVFAVYALFGASMLAGVIFAASQLVYYRIG
jgi:hypothetical protein